MAFGGKVDVISPVYSDNADHINEQHTVALQRKKWRVLVISFFSVLTILLIGVWSRPAIYQSQALLHFSYVQQLDESALLVPTEQISLNQQRLTNMRILQLLKERLLTLHNITMSVEALSLTLSVDANLKSRTLTLIATGENSKILSPILTTWLDIYLRLLDEEVDRSGIEKTDQINEMLVTLNTKIDEQKLTIAEFSELHNIVSLERSENRVLNKIKALNASIDEAESTTFKTTELLERIEKSTAEGRLMTRPTDANFLGNINNKITELENLLSNLSEKYTQKYMDKDPKIIGMNKTLQRLYGELAQAEKQSQADYLIDVKREKESSIASVKSLSEQLALLSKEAQTFDQKLKEFNTLNQSLNQLTAQAQTLKNQLVEEQVQRPRTPKINILEQPFEPSYPISPNYINNSLYSLAAAIFVAISALLIFSFIVRQKQAPASVANYNVMHGHAISRDEQQRQALALDNEKLALPTSMLDQAVPGLENSAKVGSSATPNLRLLTTSECQKLFENSTKQGKALIALMLCGVSLKEITSVMLGDVDITLGHVNMDGVFAREIILPEDLHSLFEELISAGEPNELVVGNDLSLLELSQILINTGHDANISFPEQLSLDVLRHTYLTFIALQGARLNDLEKVAGFIRPTELAFYRGVSRKETPLSVEELTAIYPLNWHG